MTDLKWLFDMVESLGIAGGPVFFGLWWLERNERRGEQVENRKQIVQLLAAVNQAATGFATVNALIATLADDTKDAFNTLIQAVQRRGAV